jgi:hypothetical protein
MEDVYDLLAPRCGAASSSSSSVCDERDHTKERKGARLKLRETVDDGVVVEGLQQLELATVSEALELIRLGEGRRATGCTDMNSASSRSHAVISAVVEQTFPDGSSRRSKVVFADLAGGIVSSVIAELVVFDRNAESRQAASVCTDQTRWE